MHYSGVLVVAAPEHLADCARRLESLRGVEVHCRDADSGRLIVVIETASPAAQPETLRRIQALPDVILAELVFHYRDEEADGDRASGSGGIVHEAETQGVRS